MEGGFSGKFLDAQAATALVFMNVDIVNFGFSFSSCTSRLGG